MQHSIVLPTTEKIGAQRDAIVEKITKIVEAAAASNVNIICFQEAWSKFSFCLCKKKIFLYTYYKHGRHV